ncbi:MAG TPA: hypothetical protein VFR24_27335 [Candidatus Angelobacter sp.]|nr:hypothetical protein [Candidatus Angelobacter sp.]
MDPNSNNTPLGPGVSLPMDFSNLSLVNPYPKNYVTPNYNQSTYDYAKALLQNSEGAVPGTRGGWTVGLQHLVDALVGGSLQRQANNQELASRGYDAAKTVQAPQTYGNTFNSNQNPAPEAASPEGAGNASQGADKLAPIIGNMEGKTYDRVVPSINAHTGQKQYALGKYGIMDFNIAPWTTDVLGRPMSAQEFLKNPQAQDAVAKAKLAEYTQKYGVEGAARAWIGGEGGVNHPERTDAFGTSVGSYGRQAAQAYANTGNPAEGNPGQQAIMNALKVAASGKAPAALPGEAQPPGALPGQQPIIPPYMIMRRPQVGRGDLEQLQGSPWAAPEQKAEQRGYYMQQNLPPVVPYLGGQVVVNPNNPTQQFFAPGVEKGTVSGPGGMQAPVQTYVAPGPDGRPQMHMLAPQEGLFGAGPGGGSSAPPPAPNVSVPGGGGQQAPAGLQPLVPTPPISVGNPIPAAPAPAAPAPASGPKGPVLFDQAEPKTNVGQVAAPGQVAGPGVPSNVPASQSVTPPGTSEQVLNAAEGVLPPVAPGGQTGVPSPASAPMGNKVAQALATQPPTSNNPKEAGLLNDMANFGLQYEKQKDLNTKDNKNLEDALKQYYTAGQIAQKGLPMLEVAQQYVNDPRFYSGFLQEPYEAVQKGRAAISEFFGGNAKAAAAPMEIFQKILSGNIVGDLKMTLGGLGQIRLAEINLITQSVANKYNSPAANKAVLQVMLREHAQAANVARIAQAYQQGYVWDNSTNQYARNTNPITSGGLNGEVMSYIERHPLFTDQEIQDINNVLQTAPHVANPKVNAAQTQQELTQQAADLGILVGGQPQAQAPQGSPPAAAPAQQSPEHLDSLIFGK